MPTPPPLPQIAPTMDEAKALKMYRGPARELSPPEQFLLVMAGVPRLVNKVGWWRCWEAPCAGGWAGQELW